MTRSRLSTTPCSKKMDSLQYLVAHLFFRRTNCTLFSGCVETDILRLLSPASRSRGHTQEQTERGQGEAIPCIEKEIRRSVDAANVAKKNSSAGPKRSRERRRQERLRPRDAPPHKFPPERHQGFSERVIESESHQTEARPRLAGFQRPYSRQQNHLRGQG